MGKWVEGQHFCGSCVHARFMPILSVFFQTSTMSLQLAQKFVRSLLSQTGRRPWLKWYPMLDSKSADVLDEASDVLCCSDRLGQSLYKLHAEMDNRLSSKPTPPPLGLGGNIVAHNSTKQITEDDLSKTDYCKILDDVLDKMESDVGFPGPARRLYETLTTEEFMDFIKTGAPFVDVGVSIFHGSQTHRIQRQVLVDHLGMDGAKKVMETIAIPGLVRVHPRNPARTCTPFSDLMDSAVFYNYANPEGKKVRDIFSTDYVPVESNEMYFPVMDGRSAEWLQCLFVSGPPECFGNLTAAVMQEVILQERMDEVHDNIFVTGLETHHPDVRRAYKQLGFNLPPAKTLEQAANI